MTPNHLLPANATDLEQALSLACDPLSRLVLPTEAIRGFKTEPADPLLPWLIWEYGLGELLPYLSEPRRAITEGILWQRLRGTPKALTIALGWIGAQDVFIEPEVPGVHFAEFQIDPGCVLDDERLIADLIAVAKLSAPARSRLSRLYHGWDLRRFLLDESLLGEALLSDHSGVFWQDGATKLSFGWVRKFAHPPLAMAAEAVREAARFAWARLLDRWLLDFSMLGDPGHTPNPGMVHERQMTLANGTGIPDPAGVLPERRFCKAMVVLSDSTVLGDTNANLPRFAWQETGSTMGLGDGVLSTSDHRLRRVEVLERLDTRHPETAFIPTATPRAARLTRHVRRVPAQAFSALGLLRLGEEERRFDQTILHRLHELATRERQVWTAMRWPAARWRDLFRDPPDPGRTELTPVRTFCRAMVVFSDSTALGDTNANLPKYVWQEEGSPPVLGDGAALSGAYRYRRIAVLERTLAIHPVAIAISPASGGTARRAVAAHPVHARADAPLGLLRLGEGALPRDRIFREATHHCPAPWLGQGWISVVWPASSWRETRELIGTAHRTQI
ncbi:MAG: phage tail protein [Rhizobium sp.]|nr:phage tail protein [Rhizobium sp.]